MGAAAYKKKKKKKRDIMIDRSDRPSESQSRKRGSTSKLDFVEDVVRFERYKPTPTVTKKKRTFGQAQWAIKKETNFDRGEMTRR